MMDFMGMMKQAQPMQAKMVEAQLELEQTVVEGEAGGGLVKVTLTGEGRDEKRLDRPESVEARREATFWKT